MPLHCGDRPISTRRGSAGLRPSVLRLGTASGQELLVVPHDACIPARTADATHPAQLLQLLNAADRFAARFTSAAVTARTRRGWQWLCRGIGSTTKPGKGNT